MAGGGANEGTAYVAERPKAFCKYAKKLCACIITDSRHAWGHGAISINTLGGGGMKCPP